MKTFHKRIGFPKGLRVPKILVISSISQHARERIRERSLVIPAIVDLSKENVSVIEVTGVEVNGRFIPTKLLIRIVDLAFKKRGLNGNDLCLSVALSAGEGCRLVTAYVNDSVDSHATLDESRYAKPA